MFEEFLSVLKSIATSLKQLADHYTADKQPSQGLAVLTGAATKETAVVQTQPFAQAALAPATREQCGNALIALATSKGRDAAVDVLAQFSAKLVKDVKEADIPAFFAAIAEASK